MNSEPISGTCRVFFQFFFNSTDFCSISSLISLSVAFCTVSVPFLKDVPWCRGPGHESVMFSKSWLVLDLTQDFIGQRSPKEHPTAWSITQFSFALEPLLPGPFLPMCQSTSRSYPCVYLCIYSFVFSVAKQTTYFLGWRSSDIAYWLRWCI